MITTLKIVSTILLICILPAFCSVENKLSDQEFINEVYNQINNTRSFKGLLPLALEETARLVANDHANYLVDNNSLSYFNNKNQGPDERYTTYGGTGAIIEIINGFKKEKEDVEIILTKQLAKQLVEALTLSEDDSKVLFSLHINFFAFGFLRSKDNKLFVGVCEFITKGGDFKPLNPGLNFGEKLSVSGKVNLPYKFKAVSIAYYDMDYIDNDSDSINTENLKPYFPPQDYIAFGDNSKRKLINILKGIGFIGAIGGAPFTGGATSLLAPIFLHSIQAGPPREIPLKSGIKANSKGDFSGLIELNYKNMPGLYFISILAEQDGVEYPLVISRRTVKVNQVIEGKV